MRRTTKPNRPRVPEKSVESAIVTRLQLSGWRVHKLDTQSMAGRNIEYNNGGKASTRRYVDPTAVVGQPDLVAVRAWDGEPKHHGSRLEIYDVLYCETKAIDGKLSPAQRACHAVLRKAGFVVLVPHSEAEFEAQMKELGLELR